MMAFVGHALWPLGCLDEAKARKEPTQCTGREEQGAASFCREAADHIVHGVVLRAGTQSSKPLSLVPVAMPLTGCVARSGSHDLWQPQFLHLSVGIPIATLWLTIK